MDSVDNWEDDGGAVPAVEAPPTLGPVASIKEVLAEKDVKAMESIPEGLEFVGWLLDGHVYPYTPTSSLARPLYAYPEDHFTFPSV